MVTISLKQLLLVLGGVLASVGLVLGLMPISHDGGPCGSAFVGSDDTSVEAHVRAIRGSDPFAFQGGCEDAVSSRRTVAIALGLPGLLLLGGGVMVSAPAAPQPTRSVR